LKRLWGWVQENSAALQGIAAIVFIIGVFITIPSFVTKALRPDLVVRVNIDDSTIPPDMIQFNKDVSHLLNWDADTFQVIKEQNKKLADILDDPVLKRLDTPSLEFDKARVEVINQSNSVISGLRIRFDNVFSLWGVDISGTFLGETEVDRFKAVLKDGIKGNSIILPELPTIPPNSSIEIILFGNLDLLKPTITTVGHSFSVTEIVEVENGFLVGWYQKPIYAVSFLLIFLPFILSILGVIWTNVRRRVVSNEKKNIFYNRACELAVGGNADDAMIVLRQAVEAGYSNRQHAIKDEDLESLRERKDFIELFQKT